MNILIFLILLFSFSITCFANCDDAATKCKSECSSEFKISKIANCENACKKGLNACEDEEGQLSDKCDAFRSICKRVCDNDFCEDACQTGYKRCD